MDKQLFVQNVKTYCKLRGVKPTVACRESGVGTSFINNIEARDSSPSVEKVQMLAHYLGVSTSELLGETTTFLDDGPPQHYLVARYNRLSPAAQQEVMAFVEFKAAAESKKND